MSIAESETICLRKVLKLSTRLSASKIEKQYARMNTTTLGPIKATVICCWNIVTVHFIPVRSLCNGGSSTKVVVTLIASSPSPPPFPPENLPLRDQKRPKYICVFTSLNGEESKKVFETHAKCKPQARIENAFCLPPFLNKVFCSSGKFGKCDYPVFALFALPSFSSLQHNNTVLSVSPCERRKSSGNGRVE